MAIRYKHRFAGLLCFLGAASLFTACGQKDKEVYDVRYPENIRIVEPLAKDEINSIDDLALAIDTKIFQSEADAFEMFDFQLTEVFASEALREPESFVGKVLQTAPLAHNFTYSYDDSMLADGIFSVRAGFSSDYASVSIEEEPEEKVLSYEFYKNVLEPGGQRLSWEDLPICSKSDDYLYVKNSEQLFFALVNGYLPYCEEGSSAREILAKCVGILSEITHEGMSQAEIYTAIYQYVVQTVQYGYGTQEYSGYQNRTNRAFFLEGAVLDEQAVCDGLTKEIVVLSRLMGLEAWHIGARNRDEGHAYLYVNIDGTWYLSCPTRGNCRFPKKDGTWQSYHTNNYLLTDFDTNMEGWDYDSDSHEDIELLLRETQSYDHWRKNVVQIGKKQFCLHPETAEDAMTVLKDAVKLNQKLGTTVQVELCGKVDVLKKAYDLLKQEGVDVIYLSGGTFEGQRLQIYLIGTEN